MLKSLRLSWIALGAGAYLAFAIATLPAATAYHWFGPEPLRLSGLAGTIWSGSADLGSAEGLTFRDLRWNLHAGALLLGRLSADVEARLADGFVSTSLSAGVERARFRNLQATTRVATLSGLLPLGDARGNLSVSLDALELADGWPVNAVGTVRLAELAVPPLLSTSGGELVEIGSFSIELTDSGGQGIMGSFRDTAGPLEVTNGSLRLGLDRSYELRAQVRARAAASDELMQGVNLMTGEPGVEGMRPFEFSGSL